VLVAVIGKRWLSAADEEGRRRLDNPEDFVRVEVGTALKRGVRVIPVLVEGASMPRAAELPEELKPLARRNALNVSHEGFRADSERLIDSVGEVLEAARVEGPPRPPEGELRRGPVAGQGKTEAPQGMGGMGAGPGAPASNRTPLNGVTASLKRPPRLLVVIGSGVVVVVVCLLGVGPFQGHTASACFDRGLLVAYAGSPGCRVEFPKPDAPSQPGFSEPQPFRCGRLY